MRVIGYAYDADVHCIDCSKKAHAFIEIFVNGRTIKESIDREARDSEGNPPGVIFDTDEADTPQHCTNCGEFLGNALTDDGRKYVEEKLNSGRGDPFVLNQWKEFYGSQLSSS